MLDWAAYIDPIVLNCISGTDDTVCVSHYHPICKTSVGWAPTSLHNEVQKLWIALWKKYNFKDYVSSVQLIWQYSNY